MLCCSFPIAVGLNKEDPSEYDKPLVNSGPFNHLQESASDVRLHSGRKFKTRWSFIHEPEGTFVIERAGNLVLSATDVANHLSCHHLTTLNLLLAKGKLPAPAWENPHLRMLRERGLEHERAYVETLRAKGLEVADISGEADDTAGAATVAAMVRGTQVIVQGRFSSGHWQGRPDVLLRVERPSNLGTWSYEVVDCKLARETKAETILQLCLYSELLAQAQGVEPEFVHVIRPGANFEPETRRLTSFAAYFRLVKQSLTNAVAILRQPDDTHPERVSHCDICRWWRRCDGQLRQEDSIVFVAGASRLQRKELAAHNVVTLEQLGNLPLPIPFDPTHGSREGYTRIRDQARIQLEGRNAHVPRHELLQLIAGKGLSRLPEPTRADVFFDIEGDPFAGEGGAEYLFGFVQKDEQNRSQYSGVWAQDRAAEKAAYEEFITLITARLERFPNMHIYHFGTYEPAAIKRLMSRYASKEDQVDRLLRGGVFIDLHSIIKQSLIASVEQYSLKDLEQFCNYRRVVELADASKARHVIEHALEQATFDAIAEETKNAVRGYNEDDCRSTEALRDWLEQIRLEQVRQGTNIARPAARDPEPAAELAERQRRVMELFRQLTQGLPAEPKNRSQEESARWLLAHALDWHRREEKVSWWEFFRLKDLSDDEMHDDKSALAGLVWRERLPQPNPRIRRPTDRYRYPAQECSIKEGDDLYLRDEDKFGEVVSIDPIGRTIDVRKVQKHAALHPNCVFTHSHFGHEEQSDALLRLAEWVVANGMNAAGHEHRAARDLLLRNHPRLSRGEPFEQASTETVLARACRLVLLLDHSILPIQGPPGAGKTYTGAQMIVELIKTGKRVGVIAVTHKVIRKLLSDAANAAERATVRNFACAHKGETRDLNARPVRELADNAEALDLLQKGHINVLGGTNYMWSRREFLNAVDVLFIDEAGQMSLANALACAQAGRSLVLLGDPQQLEQPQQGSHPEGSDVSALAHLLRAKPTIEDSQGIFLPTTWRLHPNICRFTSEMFYEGRLNSEPGLENQTLAGAGRIEGAGLWFIPVQHERNQNRSVEEVGPIVEVITALIGAGSQWVDKDRNRRALSPNDLIVVAPYNSQVDLLAARFPGIRIGTVDRFQGQEGIVVIYSLASSSASDAPRGMEFLYDLNRFNVATSRARSACIVVGSPALLEPECHTPKQMERANVLCRYSEMSTRIEIQPAAAAGAALHGGLPAAPCAP